MYMCALTQACLRTHMEVKGQLVRVGPSGLILEIHLKLSGLDKCLYLLSYLSGSEIGFFFFNFFFL